MIGGIGDRADKSAALADVIQSPVYFVSTIIRT
jgi:hypothetical protein